METPFGLQSIFVEGCQKDAHGGCFASRRTAELQKLPPLTGCQFSMAADCALALCIARMLGSRRRALKPRKPFTALAPTILARDIICSPA